MGNLAVIVKSKAKEGKRDEIRRLYEELMAPQAEANDSQEVVVWCGDQHDPDACAPCSTKWGAADEFVGSTPRSRFTRRRSL